MLADLLLATRHLPNVKHATLPSTCDSPLLLAAALVDESKKRALEVMRIPMTLMGVLSTLMTPHHMNHTAHRDHKHAHHTNEHPITPMSMLIIVTSCASHYKLTAR